MVRTRTLPEAHVAARKRHNKLFEPIGSTPPHSPLSMHLLHPFHRIQLQKMSREQLGDLSPDERDALASCASLAIANRLTPEQMLSVLEYSVAYSHELPAVIARLRSRRAV